MGSSSDDGLQFTHARVVQVRFARHTARLPGKALHLEFTQRADGTAPASPSCDDLPAMAIDPSIFTGLTFYGPDGSLGFVLWRASHGGSGAL
jgi:hypothetical protein